MSARQRLRSALQTTRPQTICWRCSLKQQQRQWLTSSASLSAPNSVRLEGCLSRSRIPNQVPSSARRRVEYCSTGNHHGLLQDALLATTSTPHYNIAGERRSSGFNQKIPSPPMPAGICPAIVTPLSQHVWSKNAPMFTVMGPPLQRTRKIPYTCSARSLAMAQSETELPPEDHQAALVGLHQPAEISIREHLRRWQEQQPSAERGTVMLDVLADRGEPGAARNIITRPQDGDRLSDVCEGRDEDNSDIMIAADLGDQVHDVAETLPFLQQGDMVELFGASGPILAIFIRELETQSQFYTMHGKWVHRKSRQIWYAVPRFVPRSLVAQILPYLPQTEVEDDEIDQLQVLDPSVPREVGAVLVKPMLTFFETSNVAFRRFARRFADAHNIMSHNVEIRYATLEEIATKVIGGDLGDKYPAATLWALHRALTQNNGFTLDQRNHRITGSFEIRPKRDAETIEQVQTWMREYQEDLIAEVTAATTGIPYKSPHEDQVIAGFVRKARAIVEHSRKRRAVTSSGAIGPSSVKVDYNTMHDKSTYRSVALDEFPYSSQEILVIRALEAWAATRTVDNHSSLASLGPMILRATGLYEGYNLGFTTGFVFLQEMGVVEPWANRRNYESRLALPGHGLNPETIKLLRSSEKAAWKKESSPPEDAMGGLRKDWGDLEVFCIDGEGAAEIDDGISLERVGDSSEFWVHVHTANPSAFLSPCDAIARYAAHLTETVYFPDVLYPMLNPKMTQKYFSLAADRPSLTFSAKLTENGEILDAKITPGTVRNVSHVTPETVHRVLSGVEADTSISRIASITVGGEMPDMLHPAHKRNMLQTLSPSQQETLRTLRDLGAAARHRREGRGAVGVNLPTPEATVYLNDAPNLVVYPWRKRARYIEGDPIISMHPKVYNPIPDTVRYSDDMLVPDMMILAGEVAGKWCRDRSVPVIYRGTVENPENQSPEAFRREYIDPHSKRLGYDPLHLVSQYLKLAGKSISTPYPMKHAILGLEAYTKVTSPLRRYGDLLAHWQIESALRHEAQTDRSLVDNRSGSDQFLPYSYSQIESMIPRVSGRERMISRAKYMSQRHWVLILLFRAHYFKEAPLPETYEMFIYNKGRITEEGKYSGILIELGMDVEMAENPLTQSHGGVELGDRWETKIQNIDIYLRSCTMEPVRLIEKAQPFDSGVDRL
ncbi:MAG: hypothetical protein FRX48_00786 [Lasallia pustulata]|uniref:RNB domain-containing protein n=1 Tax=Lasallia pustulata TaxID=136370 RepID=A0A5M8Q3W6_9LECA|nr:MAG: hypothetical protein FRX48_00786 [Lasallia pustulata]